MTMSFLRLLISLREHVLLTNSLFIWTSSESLNKHDEISFMNIYHWLNGLNQLSIWFSHWEKGLRTDNCGNHFSRCRLIVNWTELLSREFRLSAMISSGSSPINRKMQIFSVLWRMFYNVGYQKIEFCFNCIVQNKVIEAVFEHTDV